MTECGPCGKFFSSTTAFDRHRVGEHWPVCTRRCLEDHEMEALGMWEDKLGRWTGPVSEKQREHLTRLATSDAPIGARGTEF